MAERLLACAISRTIIAALAPARVLWVPLGGATRVFLRVRKDVFALRFSYSLDGNAWSDVCGELDGSHLCDEAYRELKSDGHTGPFAGMACVDLTGRRLPADFRSFSYRALG